MTSSISCGAPGRTVLPSNGSFGAALVSDVRLAESDAILVELEHREGAVMAVFLPYTRSRMRKRIEYGGLAASAAEPHVWSE
jgi:hypothetical protein